MFGAVSYEYLDHTADIGLKAYGSTLEEIFENAAVGMFDIMTDVETVEARGEVKVRVESQDLESLMVDWLTELLYVHELENVFLSAFEVAIHGLSLEATAKGETVDPSKHSMDLSIKAVTYHMIEVNEREGYAIVIFDI